MSGLNNAFMALHWSHENGTFPDESWEVYRVWAYAAPQYEAVT